MKLRVSLINLFHGKNKEKGLERQKKLLEKYNTSKLCGGFIGVPERMKTMQITKRHLIQLRLKINYLKEAMSLNDSNSFYAYVRCKQNVFVRQGWTMRRQCWKYNITRFFISAIW